MANYFPAYDTSESIEAAYLENKVQELQVRGSEQKLYLVKNYQHPIKKDKKGQNPAPMLLRVLYKHLMSLIEQKAIVLEEKLQKEQSFD